MPKVPIKLHEHLTLIGPGCGTFNFFVVKAGPVR
jgi:hypothetical protein